MKFNEKLRNMRKQKNMTLKQLAKLTGLSESSIHKYEGGTRIPKHEQIFQLASALQCSVVDLLDDDNNVFQKWDVQYADIKHEYDVIEEIRKLYSSDTVTLLEHYTALNDIGKAKANEYILDLLKLYKEGE